MGAKNNVRLSIPEILHILNLLDDNKHDDYWWGAGNEDRKRHWEKHRHIVKELNRALKNKDENGSTANNRSPKQRKLNKE